MAAEGFHISDAGFARPERARSERGPEHGEEAALHVMFDENRVFNERTQALVGTMIHLPLGICIAMAFVCWLGALGIEIVPAGAAGLDRVRRRFPLASASSSGRWGWPVTSM